MVVVTGTFGLGFAFDFAAANDPGDATSTPSIAIVATAERRNRTLRRRLSATKRASLAGRDEPARGAALIPR